jgi:hypothetical protein
VWPRRRQLPQCLLRLVDLEPSFLKVLDDPLGELLSSIIGRVLFHDTAK